MAVHINDTPGLHRLMTDNGLLDEILSCKIRDTPQYQVAGYCQALTSIKTLPESHTRRFVEHLNHVGARYPNSHELALATKPPDLSFEEWVRQATLPFLEEGSGCVPVVITGLDVADQQVSEIFGAKRLLSETVLVRVLVNEHSIETAAALMRHLVSAVRERREVPGWWPLFQTSFGPESWRSFKAACAEDWRYGVVAINPFVEAASVEIIADQIGVAQLPIGHAEGIGNSIIYMGPVRVTGAPHNARYYVDEYAATIRGLPREEGRPGPVLIVLGPSQPEFTDDDDIKRLRLGLECFRAAGLTV